MQKISSLQCARGIAAISVLLFHSASIHTKYIQHDFSNAALFAFGQTGVDLFFVISGFVMAVAFRNKPQGAVHAINFLKDRFFRIYPTYWVYLILVFIVFSFNPSMVNSSQAEEPNLFASAFLLPQNDLPLLMVAWTLTHEVWFYMVFAAILMLPTAHRVGGTFAWLTVILLNSALTAPSQNIYFRLIEHELSIEFIFGALTGFTYLKICQRPATSALAIPMLLITGLSGLLYASTFDVIENSSAHSLLERALIIGGSYSALILATAMVKSNPLPSLTILLEKVGILSYSLYLSHLLTLSACGRAWRALELPSGTGWTIAFWVVATLTTLLVSHISCKTLEASSFFIAKKIRLQQR